MTAPISSFSVKELREKSRDRVFLSLILEEDFDYLFKLLQQNTDSGEQLLDILSTIANVLLVNRTFVSLHLPKRVNQYFPLILDLAGKEYTKLTKKVSDDEKFKNIAVYRLIFLVLNTDEGLLKPLIQRSYDILLEAFKLYDVILEKYQSRDDFSSSLNEITKGLIQCACKFKWIDKNEILPTCNDIFDNTLQTPINTTTKMLLIKSLASLKYLCTFEIEEIKIDFSDPILYKKSIVFDNYMNFLKPQIELFENNDQSVGLSDLVTLISILCVEYSKFRKVFPTMKKTQFLKEFHGYYLDQFIPTEKGENYYYCKLLQLVDSQETNEVLQRTAIGVSHQLKNLILDWYYSMYLNLYEDHLNAINLLLQSFGWTNAINYLLSNNIDIPSSINPRDYQHPNPSFINPKYFNSVSDDNEGSIIDCALRHISTGSLASPGEESPPEMTEEEKEREAEKIFVVLQRAERNPMFKNFKNPIREWQQLGRFENI